MSGGKSDRLADLLAALRELSGQLGLPGDREGELLAEVDALRAGSLWQAPAAEETANRLAAMRSILQSAGDNRLAAGAIAEIDAILA